ncbi:MAG: ABC transporter permease [Inquilinus sp.]|uniref:ABC transporter permease n=1 Tax=Inquilinus sp. TaxID=1932117 RepID=UPI003F391309
MSAAGPERGSRWLGGYVGVYLVFLYLPIVLIPLFSFNDSIQIAFPIKGFTLSWYRSLLDNEALHGAVGTSLIVGLSAAALATFLGVTIAYMEITDRGRVAAAISVLARLPILIPGVIIGIALLILVNLAGLGPSRAAMILGHTLVALPTTVVVMRSRFSVLPRSLGEAAMDLGAHEWTTFHRVMLPLSAPAIASAFMLSFLTSFDEFVVAFFLAGTEPTLPVFIWSQLRFPKALPGVMALGTVILAVSVVLATAAELFRRRGLGGKVAMPASAVGPLSTT